MKKFILTCLGQALLLATLCLPAQARVTIGLAPTAPLSAVDQATINRLDTELSSSAGSPVTLRQFDSEATLSNWLLRFQELDAAIVGREYLAQQPAGTLRQLADLHDVSNTSQPLTLVVRRNLDASRATLIQDAFLQLAAADRGRKILAKLGLADITAPGAPPRRAEPQVRPKPLKPAPPQPAAAIPLPAPRPLQEEPAKVAETTEKTTAAIAATAPQGSEKAPSAAAPEPAAPPLVKPQPGAEGLPLAAEPPTAAETGREETLTGGESNEQPATSLQPAAPAAPDLDATIKAAPSKRLLIFIALIILVAILLKTGLLVLRWRNSKAVVFKPVAAPTVLPSRRPEVRKVPPAAAVPAPAKEPLIIETGQLELGKVPALLKRCAGWPEPVVLQVTKGSCAKLVYFVAGQIAGALTQNATTTESGVRWNKLGNLLVREGLLTREQRDQGMALVTRDPSLRFGEALLKLGLIDLAALRHALTRQTKVTIYSLVLFPEGRYRVFTGDGSLPADESVALDVDTLIREAAQHQSEWQSIRKALPNLNKVLDFSRHGRDKLAKVRISAQQEATLSLVDGRRTIDDVCVESTMMDYEVYRFLYLMVKADVLQ